ncbi:MAG: inorganic phosphate transporter [Chloroflexi bacterium]|nr:inorganic phosphate transporter [Chloroflexota bacterium]
MHDASLWLVVAVIVVALIFDVTNGFNDAANAIATVVSTRVLSPLAATAMAAVLNLAGAVSGTAVAKTVGGGIVDKEAVTLVTVLVAVGAAALWVFVATRLGLPISGSHSLISAVAGAAVATAGWEVLIPRGVVKVLLPMAIAPVVGVVGGFLFMVALYWVFRRWRPSTVNAVFGKLQMLSAAGMAFSHGSNDAQKTMGVIALALFVYQGRSQLTIDWWVILLAGVSMAIGTYLGGRRVIKTLGMRLVRMQPVNGFCAETSAAAVIETASRFGLPLSTTHVITSTIIGQGATRRFSAVSWGLARRIVGGWIVTFPLCGVLAWTMAKVLLMVT